MLFHPSSLSSIPSPGAVKGRLSKSFINQLPAIGSLDKLSHQGANQWEWCSKDRNFTGSCTIYIYHERYRGVPVVHGHGNTMFFSIVTDSLESQKGPRMLSQVRMNDIYGMNIDQWFEIFNK